jgi:hypothetical protein
MSTTCDKDYNIKAKRLCKANQSILNLPIHIQYIIINNMNMVNAMVLSNLVPQISDIVNKIKWDNIKYSEKEKTDMLIDAFESLDINIINKLFKTVSYTSIDKINIDNNTFNKIIEICYYNSFIEGINFLAEFKDEHYVSYKNHTDNQDNQYQLVSEYIKNNSIEPRKIFLNLIILHNNIELFSYIEKYYQYGIYLNFNDYKNQLFNHKDLTLAIKIKSTLNNSSKNIEIINYYNNELSNIAFKHNIIF